MNGHRARLRRCRVLGADRHVERGYNAAVRNVVFVTSLPGKAMEAQLPELGAPCCDGYEGDGGIVVRNSDTEVVIAATRTITGTIAIEYG
jgi:hypothetical protein